MSSINHLNSVQLPARINTRQAAAVVEIHIAETTRKPAACRFTPYEKSKVTGPKHLSMVDAIVQIRDRQSLDNNPRFVSYLDGLGSNPNGLNPPYSYQRIYLQSVDH
jgi:hypothetical protein